MQCVHIRQTLCSLPTRSAAVILGALLTSQVVASMVQAPGFTAVKSLGGIDEYRLDSNVCKCSCAPTTRSLS
jgi:hypothetical protein